MPALSNAPSPLNIICLELGPFQTNCYIVSHGDSKQALIIDPGDAPDLVLAKLRNSNLLPHSVVLTHGHIDHINAAAAFAAQNIPVLIHSADAAMLTDLGASGAAWFGLPQNTCQPGGFLEDGGELDIWQGALIFRIMHTPGHSPGSICLVSKDVAFVGDLIFAGSIGRSDLPGGDPEVMTQSLLKFMQLPDTIALYPGHGPATTIGDERISNPFLC
jgi:glyoxylase-like metal-dependent hydrolase (beta-lactamase superfamily II)